VLFFSGGASFSGAELVLIFLSSLAIIFPDADLSDQVELPLRFRGQIFVHRSHLKIQGENIRRTRWPGLLTYFYYNANLNFPRSKKVHRNCVSVASNGSRNNDSHRI
jgi:hypothetical protein